MDVDRDKAKHAVELLLRSFGQDASVEQTAARIVDAWADEILDGYGVDVPSLIRREAIPADGKSNIVVLRGLAVSTMCPHHMLPARGTADVVYAPGPSLLGLGAIARVVDAFSHRFALQESIGAGVTAALVDHLGARGAACRLAMSHTCLTVRGQRQADAIVETLAFSGCFAEPGAERDLAIRALVGHEP